MKRIYLDHAATTPIDSEVANAMQPFLTEQFGNPSSLHQEGKQARLALEEARAKIATFLHAQNEEIIFTGSGTESCNLAIVGVAYAQKEKGKHLITTKVEHHAVLESFEYLEKQGWQITWLDVDEFGMVNANDVANAITDQTVLVSIIMANNEVGSINPIKEINRRAKQKNPNVLVHTDACQATGYLKLDVKSLGVDLLTINASKIYGPKGVGVLYKQKLVKLDPVIHGGGQEKGLHSGTQNVPAIVGFAKAVELINLEPESIKELRDEFIQLLQKEIPSIVVNGHLEKRLPNNVNVSIPAVDGETLVIFLDQKGIACSTAAACTTASTEPSHVLLAMGKTEEEAKSSLRFTLGKSTTKEDLQYTVEKLKESIQTLSK